MRSLGNSEGVNGMANAPDTQTTLVLTAATASAIDMPSNAKYMRLTVLSSAGAALGGYVNLQSTGAIIPTSGTSSSSATGVSVPVYGPRLFFTGASTGFSVIANSSGYAHAEFWGY